MTSLAKALDEYLTLRRALGFKLREAARQLPRFVQFVEDEGASFITIGLALRWAQQNPEASSVIHADRLGMVRRFATWCSGHDPGTEIPPLRLLRRRYTRPAPYIYIAPEIEKMVASVAAFPSAKGLRGPTFSTLFGLLAVTGMRVGEAARTNGVHRGGGASLPAGRRPRSVPREPVIMPHRSTARSRDPPARSSDAE